MRSSRRATSALRVSASSSTAQCASVPSSSRSSLSSSGVVPRSSSCVPALLARFLASDPVGWGSCRHDSADAPLSPRTCSGSSRPSCVSGSSRGFLRPRTSLTRRSPTRPVPQRALAARQAADDRLGPADGQRRVPRVRGSFPSALSSPPPASFLQPDSSSLHPSQASPTSSSASSSAPTTRTSCGTSSSHPESALAARALDDAGVVRWMYLALNVAANGLNFVRLPAPSLSFPSHPLCAAVSLLWSVPPREPQLTAHPVRSTQYWFRLMLLALRKRFVPSPTSKSAHEAQQKPVPVNGRLGGRAGEEGQGGVEEAGGGHSRAREGAAQRGRQ